MLLCGVLHLPEVTVEVGFHFKVMLVRCLVAPVALAIQQGHICTGDCPRNGYDQKRCLGEDIREYAKVILFNIFAH
jgi:hypothetical protein